MPNADWVFGLPADDPQARVLESGTVFFATTERGAGFVVYVLTESPLVYSSPEDMALLRNLESALQLD